MSKYKATILNSGSLNVVGVIFCVLAVIISAWTLDTPTSSNTANKSTEKVLERGNLIYARDPIKLFEIKAANKLVKFNEKFEGADDWLKGTRLRLKNVSDKEVVHIEIDFDFPETESNGAVMAHQMMIGRRPGSPNTSMAPLSLPPGGETEVTVDEQVYGKFTELISHRQTMQSINKAKITIVFVAFADGTGYGTGGTFYRQDPNNPKRYLPVPDNPQ
jgi:hypothetical protein